MFATWSNWSYMALGVPISRCKTISSRTIHRLGGSGRSKMRCRAQPGGHELVDYFLTRIQPTAEEQRPGVIGGLEQAGDEEGLPDPQRRRLALGSRPVHEPAGDGAVGP